MRSKGRWDKASARLPWLCAWNAGLSPPKPPKPGRGGCAGFSGKSPVFLLLPHSSSQPVPSHWQPGLQSSRDIGRLLSLLFTFRKSSNLTPGQACGGGGAWGRDVAHSTLCRVVTGGPAWHPLPQLPLPKEEEFPPTFPHQPPGHPHLEKGDRCRQTSRKVEQSWIGHAGDLGHPHRQDPGVPFPLGTP